MNRLNRLMAFTVLFVAVLIIGVNVIFTHSVNKKGKFYITEINRAYDAIKNGETDFSGAYKYISNITFLPYNATETEIAVFLEAEREPYLIKTYQGGYVKFTYIPNNNEEFKHFRVMLNTAIIVFGIITAAVLLYVKSQIVKPFKTMQDMPFELSKGHLTHGLKESKNRFFGRFVWGLDMLRETLEERKLKELELLKEKKTLVLSISHDIKTPLSAIKLYTKALEQTEVNHAEIASKIDENAVKIETFITDIINASREDFLSITVHEGEFYLSDLVEKLSDYYSDKLCYIQTDWRVGEYDNCLINGDMEKCTEALENMIENAVKYGDGKEIAMNFVREENCCLITVSNTGCSLPDNETVHVFESFWRGSNSKTKKGSGLGLYISRQILVKMNGDIFAETDGERFNVTAVLRIK